MNDKLVAVKIVEHGGVTTASGFISRGKNRKRVWSLDFTGKTKEDCRLMVNAKEEYRLSFVEGLGELS